MAPPQLLRLRQVQMRVPLSRSTIYQAIADGTFPKPIPIGPNSVAWLDSDIDSWIVERMAHAGRRNDPYPSAA